MKKIVGIILTLVILGFFVNSLLETRTKEQTTKAERARFERETIDAVNALVARTNGVRGWEMALGADKADGISPTLTIALEHIWVQPRPILFVGELQDCHTKRATGNITATTALLSRRVEALRFRRTI